MMRLIFWDSPGSLKESRYILIATSKDKPAVDSIWVVVEVGMADVYSTRTLRDLIDSLSLSVKTLPDGHIKGQASIRGFLTS